MEPFVFSILILLIILGVLYFLIRIAVRDGMLDYDRIKRQNTTSMDTPPEQEPNQPVSPPSGPEK